MSNYIGSLHCHLAVVSLYERRTIFFEFAALSEHEHVDTAMKAEWSLAALSEHEHVDTAM